MDTNKKDFRLGKKKIRQIFMKKYIKIRQIERQRNSQMDIKIEEIYRQKDRNKQ